VIATAIGSAIEEQGMAAAEIGRNVTQTAQATQEVTTNIGGVSGFMGRAAAAADQLLFDGNSTGLFCLPVLKSQIFLATPGKIAEIGLTRSVGLSGVPTTS